MRIRSSRRTQNGEPRRAAVERPGKHERQWSPGAKQRITQLIVEVADRASAWGEAATDAQLAFEWWKSAGQGDRVTAAAVYLAAIEREEKAANEYSDALAACWRAAP